MTIHIVKFSVKKIYWFKKTETCQQVIGNKNRLRYLKGVIIDHTRPITAYTVVLDYRLNNLRLIGVMLSSSASASVGNSGVRIVQQVRNISRRKVAYPSYPFKRLGRKDPKSHDTNLKYAMRQFLGPRNFKGEYPMNKYFGVPTNHVPNYIKPDLERGQSLHNPLSGKSLVERHDGTYEVAPLNRRMENISDTRLLRPFPENEHCHTNYIISTDLKLQIFNDITVDGLSTQQVSQKYGLKIPRVEAIIKLYDLEQKWVKYRKVSPYLKTMSDTLYKMFPIFKSEKFNNRENLSEIPVPPSALKSRFLTIAESQPFGPIDAAKILELEPAATTLEKLSTVGEHSTGHANQTAKRSTKVVYGELLTGERSMFKFTDAKVGDVGYRYGSVNRDNKKDRKIGFNELGKMVYL